MEIIKEFSTKLQIQLVVKMTDPFTDMLRLHMEIFVIIKSYFHTQTIPSQKFISCPIF